MRLWISYYQTNIARGLINRQLDPTNTKVFGQTVPNSLNEAHMKVPKLTDGHRAACKNVVRRLQFN